MRKRRTGVMMKVLNLLTIGALMVGVYALLVVTP